MSGFTGFVWTKSRFVLKKNVRFSRISGFVWTGPEATPWGQLLNLFALTVAWV